MDSGPGVPIDGPESGDTQKTTRPRDLAPHDDGLGCGTNSRRRGDDPHDHDFPAHSAPCGDFDLTSPSRSELRRGHLSNSDRVDWPL